MSRSLIAALAFAFVCSDLRADVDYEADIKPIFQEKCGACHGVLKQEGGIRLDAGSLIRGDEDDNGLLDLDDPAASELIRRVATSDPDLRMPPDGEGTPLSSLQIKQLTQWIQQGAPSPPDEEVIESPRQHWAYQPPAKPELATDVPDPWSTNPVDALMFDKWRERGLAPVQPADPTTALRRLHFDVTGLPPSESDQVAFVSDPSDAAWNERVDHLLNDPAYGEKWGRHWMDVWRYSDWDGYKNELRGSQRHIWHWRDWIIESLNVDKGYDTMVREMLAGDEIASEDLDVLRATGFLVRNFHKSNRDIWLDATVEHTAKAFLGMTIACARCHDHKYDPISQREYYAFRAIFQPHHVRTERLAGQPDTGKLGLPRAYDADLDAETYLYIRGNEKNPDKDRPLDPSVPEIVKAPFAIQSVPLSDLASKPYLRGYIQTEELAAADRKLKAARKSLAASEAKQDYDADSASAAIARQQVTVARASLLSVQSRWAAATAQVATPKSSTESNGDPEQSQTLAVQAADAERKLGFEQSLLDVLKQRLALADAKESKEADEAKKKAAVDAAAKKLAESEQNLVDASVQSVNTDDKFTPVGKSYPATSSGRRTALANWITDAENPLTARVAVNHIWMRYFGEPLVENVDDFGLRSPRPIHHELLDWLAVELVENDWSMKHIHRLILQSQTYRLASSVAPQSQPVFAKNAEIDPDNLHFWRSNVRRLDAEQVRDNLLAVAGTLDRTMGGQDIDFGKGETILRRSIYFRHAYEKQMPMLVVFDAANPTDCYRRSESIVPQQALALANSPLAIDQARNTATRLSSEAADDPSFVSQAYAAILGRPPTPSERSTCEAFLVQQATLLSSPEKLSQSTGTAKSTVPPATDAKLRARENLVHVLFNHNDFVTVR
ncbi:Planctomycete cytochrome C [Rubripirellula lacrimiformis]|uniref:Planctomycete cytochrome C n=1 Tax=Rubripirellula lacrimiformis TaxID=1930273 RepID=A0A517NCG2_9BACT|nr:PSD1 and planctomycete cytochrome C domain-containing protein [Rubripirellula lacrimiformis]QDT04810.1 Planctomycete cytochrome C [Rubripirellula lacrimiformis]